MMRHADTAKEILNNHACSMCNNGAFQDAIVRALETAACFPGDVRRVPATEPLSMDPRGTMSVRLLIAIDFMRAAIVNNSIENYNEEENELAEYAFKLADAVIDAEKRSRR